MKNLNIGSRLGVGFAVVLLLLAALTITALVRMQTASDLTYRLINTSIKNQPIPASRTSAWWPNGRRSLN